MAKTLIARCPSCRCRLKVALHDEGSTRLRVRCSRCSQAFRLRRPEAQLEPTQAFPQQGSTHGSVGSKPAAAWGAGEARTSEPGSESASGRAEGERALWGSRASEAVGEEGDGAALSEGDALPKVARTFKVGDVLSGRYRIVRFIAEGGMGEVYEAEDNALGTAVALKTVRPGVVADPGALVRFKREIQVARQVTHGNVCRIHDLGSHRSSSPVATLYPGGEILFVTMELLEGQSLAQHLRERGALEPEEVLPLAEQIAAALDAAHRAGVVHRDLKPANVLLVPGEGGPRAVVTDFGLARGQAGGSGDVAVTAVGSIMGSPAYMAPEQVEGEAATTAVDIYALGIVLYEMTTGEVPFRGDNALSTAVKRLTEAPPPPTALRPDLDPRWESAILRCLEGNPEGRFQRGAEVVAALGGAPVAEGGVTGAEAPFGRPSSRRQVVLAAVAGVLLAVALGLNWSTLRERTNGAALQPPSVSRPAVAVMGFRNASGDQSQDWMGNGLAEMLSTELASSGQVRLIPGESLARAQVELGLDRVEALSRETLGRVREVLGSDYVVTGSFTSTVGEDRPLRLDLRLQDTLALEEARAVGVAGRTSQLFELVAEGGSRLLQALDLGEVAGGRSWWPSSTEGARLYSQGLDRLHRSDALGARELLEQAVAAEPRNPRARAALGRALISLGFVERAREEARLAVELSESLHETERHEIRAQYLQALGDWAQAVRVYEQLWTRYPDDLEYGLELAKSLTSSGQAERALEVVDVLGRLPSAAAGDVRILLAEAGAASSLGRFRQQQEAAARAATISGDRGAPLLRAWALLLEGWALRNLGEPGRALEVTGEAEELYRQAGDALGVAEAQVHRASLLFDQGDLATARRLFERTVDAYRDLGNKGKEAQVSNNLALVLRQQGHLERAYELYERSLELSRETGNRAGMAIAEINLGALQIRSGDLAGAEDRFRRASEIALEVGDRAQQASALYNLGATLRKRGRLHEAEETHRQALELRRAMGHRFGEAASLTDLATLKWELGRLAEARDGYLAALALSRQTGNRRFEAQGLYGLGKVHLISGELELAADRHREALALRREMGEQGAIFESLLALAVVDLELQRFAAAAEGARQAAAGFREQGSVDLEAMALAAWATALAFLEGPLEAQAVLARAHERRSVTHDLRLRIELELAGARVAVAAGLAPEAAEHLARAEALAEEAGLLPLALEARLMRGELAALQGDAGGRRLVEEATARARSEGLGLILLKGEG